MSVDWTAEQIIALAPDAASAKAGQSLASARHWLTLGSDGRAAWGECQGSGKNPYQTQIDLSEPAFRCSCPSRKFPCKHGLGLFLLLAAAPQAFAQTAAPQWVMEWIESRARRAVQADKRPKKNGGDETADAAAQQKRASQRAGQREAKVAAGLAELETWLCDLMRAGLAAAQTQPASFWETPARRMVDAQAPGLARLLREIAGVTASGEGWQARLLERVAKLHLLVEGYKRLDALPAETQADVRAGIGWTQNQDELLDGPGVRDRWQVLGQRVTEEDRLRVQSTWLWGGTTERAALVLHFAPGGQPLDASFIVGSVFDGELVFFPSAYPLRALVKQRHGAVEQLDAPGEGVAGYATIGAAVEAYAAALARHPWLERFPLALDAVTPASRDGGWAVRDAAGHLLPLAPRFGRGWDLMALGGGRELALFGEWDGDNLLPLSAWAEGRFVRLG